MAPTIGYWDTGPGRPAMPHKFRQGKKEGGSLDEIAFSSSARHSPGGRAKPLCLPQASGAVIQITKSADRSRGHRRNRGSLRHLMKPGRPSKAGKTAANGPRPLRTLQCIPQTGGTSAPAAPGLCSVPLRPKSVAGADTPYGVRIGADAGGCGTGNRVSPGQGEKRLSGSRSVASGHHQLAGNGYVVAFGRSGILYGSKRSISFFTTA